MIVPSMFVEDVKGDIAKKGDSITLPMEFRIRPSDKLYKLVKVEEPGTQQNSVSEGAYSH